MHSVNKRWFFICLYVISSWTMVNSAKFEDVAMANSKVIVYKLEPYENLRPVSDSDLTVTVKASWNLVGINDFDESNGYIEVSGYLELKWTGDAYVDTATIYNGSQMFKYDKIWTPPIMIVNSLSYFEEIGHAAKTRVAYNFYNKECTWKPWVTTRVGCSPDVKYYPFDTQKCVIKLAIWGYPNNEVNINPSVNYWKFSQFEENGEWQITETTVESVDDNDMSMLLLGISIKRRPMYYVLNLITPVILLGILNPFAFVLPTDSGERVGFAVTCYLSYVVLLNMIMDFLPSSAAPMSDLSYYTFVMMLFSGAVTITTIFTVRIHYKDKTKKVPAIFQYLSCRSSCRSPDTVEPLKNVTSSESDWTNENDKSESADFDKDKNTVTWPMIASVLDWIFFFGFLVGQVCFSTGYLVPMFLKWE